jgi:hypothetical protein
VRPAAGWFGRGLNPRPISGRTSGKQSLPRRSFSFGTPEIIMKEKYSKKPLHTPAHLFFKEGDVYQALFILGGRL